MSHTPGPWTYRKAPKDASTVHTPYWVDGANGVPIADVKLHNPDGEEGTARLIAAAPDILVALEEAQRMLETASRYFPKSIKNPDRFSLLNVLANSVGPAIAKAKGDRP